MNKKYSIAIEAAVDAGKAIMEIYESGDFGVEAKADDSPLTLADRAAHNVIVKALNKTPYPILSEEGKGISYEERKDWECYWLVDPLDGTKEFIKQNGEFTVNIALIEKGKPVFGVVYAPVLSDLYWGLAQSDSKEVDQAIGQSDSQPLGQFKASSWMRKVDYNHGLSLEEIEAEDYISKSEALPLPFRKKKYTVVASRSHMSADTEAYINEVKEKHGDVEIVSKGSSLKLCMVATGEANEYPRLGPTMEWDVAAAAAVVLGAGKSVTIFGTEEPLAFNKENLLNPHFLVS